MKKLLFVLIGLFILPLYVYAGGVVNCSDVNDGNVLNNWGRYNLKDYDILAGGAVNYCSTEDKSDPSLNKFKYIFILV